MFRKIVLGVNGLWCLFFAYSIYRFGFPRWHDFLPVAAVAATLLLNLTFAWRTVPSEGVISGWLERIRAENKRRALEAQIAVREMKTKLGA